jgi:hypothetical protein
MNIFKLASLYFVSHHTLQRLLGSEIPKFLDLFHYFSTSETLEQTKCRIFIAFGRRVANYGETRMQSFYLRVGIDRFEAIRVGNNQWGKVDLPVFPANVSPKHREVYKSLAILPGADAISVFPSIRRPSGTATSDDVPALLDELRSDRLFESKRQKRIMLEHRNHLRKAYKTWHSSFMQMPVALDPNELIINNDELTLPQARDYLVSFRYRTLHASFWKNLIAEIPSLDDLVRPVSNVNSGAIALTDYAEIKTWMAGDQSVTARLAEASELAAKLTLRAAELRQQMKKSREDRQEEAQAKERAEEDRIQEVERLKAQQIAAWVTVYGNDNQKARHGESLLPELEVLSAMEAQAFEPLEKFRRYEPIIATELAAVANDEGRWELVGEAITHTIFDAESVTSEEFDLMRLIKTIVPAASTKVVEHLACYKKAGDQDDPEVRRNCIRVVFRVEQFMFTRDYSVN